MEKIRIQNLRSLADTKLVELRPLTLLVGTNSSGKSSFLRVFPMLRQSAETRTGSGLLLNEPYVDYGLFPVAVRENANPKEISFEFQLRLPASYYPRSPLLENTLTLTTVVFAPRQSDGRYSYLKRLKVIIGENSPETVTIDANEDGSVSCMVIDDYPAEKESKLLKLQTGKGLIPSLKSISYDKPDGSDFVTDDGTRSPAFTDSLLAATYSIFHGKTLRETRIQILRAIRIGSPELMLQQMSQITDNGYWNQTVKGWRPETNSFRRLRTLILGDQFADILSLIGSAVGDFSKSVHYFEPVRARVQRDYVSRDIQVENVEPDGRNVAMFLASLPKSMQRNFEDWLKANFGFVVFPSAVGDGARVALRFREADSIAEFNLVDMGFGYSQILPLLVQIWAILQGNTKNAFQRRFTRLSQFGTSSTSFVVAIEQPELHLHPALQAKMADLIANTINATAKAGIQVKFIVETHSQTMINRIGQMVESGFVNSTAVQVLLFERGADENDPYTTILRTVEFDSNGVLKNWPFGFFEPKDEPKEMIETSIAKPSLP